MCRVVLLVKTFQNTYLGYIYSKGFFLVASGKKCKAFPLCILNKFQLTDSKFQAYCVKFRLLTRNLESLMAENSKLSVT